MALWGIVVRILYFRRLEFIGLKHMDEALHLLSALFRIFWQRIENHLPIRKNAAIPSDHSLHNFLNQLIVSMFDMGKKLASLRIFA